MDGILNREGLIELATEVLDQVLSHGWILDHNGKLQQLDPKYTKDSKETIDVPIEILVENFIKKLDEDVYEETVRRYLKQKAERLRNEKLKVIK